MAANTRLLLVPWIHPDKRPSRGLPLHGIRMRFDLDLEHGVLRTFSWPSREERDYLFMPWDIGAEHILYRGSKRDLPDFLPGFCIPIPRAWFDAIFAPYQAQRQTFYRDDAYRDDAYAVETGYMVYDCEEAYADGQWLEALRKMNFAIQVEWAQTAATDRRHALLEIALLAPNAQRTALHRIATIRTTQERFLMFLKSGNRDDLEPKADAA